MRRAGSRIFRNSRAWSEEPGYEVHCITRCGSDDGKCIQLSDALEVRVQILDFRLGIEDRHEIARHERFARRSAQRGDQAGADFYRLAGPGGEIHIQKLSIAYDNK